MANQVLNNLKSIHNIHVNGSIVTLVRDIRTNKTEVDSLTKKMNRRMEELLKQDEISAKKEADAVISLAKQEQEVKVQPRAEAVVEAKIEPLPKPKEQAEIENKNMRSEQKERPLFNAEQNNKIDNQNKPNFQNRPDNQNRVGNQGSFQNNNQNRFNNQNGVQGNTSTYNQGGTQTYNSNRFNNNQTRPGGQPFNGNNRYNNPQGQTGVSPFVNGTPRYNNNEQRPPYVPGQRPPFAPGAQGQRPPYVPGQRPPFVPGQRPPYVPGQRPPYVPGQRPPYVPGQRPQYVPGQRPPFAPGAQGQRLAGPGGNRFMSTRGNNFKSFAPVLESSSVLAQPERTFGNKNKTRQNVTDDKRPVKKGVPFGRYNNVIIEDENGFEEARMGSRKLIKAKKKENIIVAPKVEIAIITTDTVSVKTLSEKTGKPVTSIIKQLMLLGVMATINSNIDLDTAELISGELGVKLETRIDKTFEEKLVAASEKTEEDDSEKRPPVVTVMGHVDHGKTSLLDALRKTNVVSGEAGGITQKIGAYQINVDGEKITFLDTPGHAAFTAMRARGAGVTDIAILVVAADDGIMPQTIEAINHIKAAKVPMIVAINKMDKPEANPEKIKQQLSDHGVLPEEWGGDAILVPISAKTGMGLDELKKMILLVAELQDFKASVNKMATGVVIEAELDKNRGPKATILIQTGVLNVGDNIVSGLTYGKVKAMYDDKGKKIDKATPSTPVEVLGFNEVPASGDQVFEVDEKFSKQVILERKNKIKQNSVNKTSGVSLDDFMNKVNEGKLKNLNIIIKADTQGSVEALSTTLSTISNEEVKVNIVHAGVGGVTESDVVLAGASSAVVICFNQKANQKAAQLADSLKIEIKEYKVIYEIVDDISKTISGMLTIKYEEKVIGHGEIRAVFKLSSAGQVAGVYITDGLVTRKSVAKVLRDDEEIGRSDISSLKIVKDEKSEISKGFECGIKLKDNIAIKEGDILEFYINEPIKRG